MGTTCGPKPANVRLDLMGQYTFETENVESVAIDCMIVQLRTAYLAVRRTDKATGERRVHGVVVLLSYTKGPYPFCEKHIDEEMGPYEAKCPPYILSLLTPTDNEQAKEWRQRCWDNIDNPNRPYTVYAKHGEKKKYQKLPAAIKYAKKLTRIVGENIYIDVEHGGTKSLYGMNWYANLPFHIDGPKVLTYQGEAIQ